MCVLLKWKRSDSSDVLMTQAAVHVTMSGCCPPCLPFASCSARSSDLVPSYVWGGPGKSPWAEDGGGPLMSRCTHHQQAQDSGADQ